MLRNRAAEIGATLLEVGDLLEGLLSESLRGGRFGRVTGFSPVIGTGTY